MVLGSNYGLRGGLRGPLRGPNASACRPFNGGADSTGRQTVQAFREGIPVQASREGIPPTNGSKPSAKPPRLRRPKNQPSPLCRVLPFFQGIAANSQHAARPQSPIQIARCGCAGSFSSTYVYRCPPQPTPGNRRRFLSPSHHLILRSGAGRRLDNAAGPPSPG